MSCAPIRKLLPTPNGVTYGYSLTTPSSLAKPTILFLHGFPDDRSVWDAQVAHFTKLGYGAIVPDMLGYGETDKPDPENVGEYRYKKMSESLFGILDEEGVDKVVLAGHDWGVPLATRFNLYYPQRVLANIWTSVVYFPPSPIRFSLTGINNMFKKAYGYQSFAYWEFMLNPTSPALLTTNIESSISILYPRNAYPIWRAYLCEPGKFAQWICSNKICNVAEWFTPERQAEFKARMVRDGFPLNWYRAHAENWNYEDELQFNTKEKLTIATPVLQILSMQDPVSPPGNVEFGRNLLPDLKVEVFKEGGHWVMGEMGCEWNRAVETFLREKGI